MTENCPHCLHELPNPDHFGPLKAFPEVGIVILGDKQYKLSPKQAQIMVLFIEKFNQPVHVEELQTYLYGNTAIGKHAVWQHLRILSDRVARTGYKIEHVCSSTWRLCKDEPVRQSSRESSAA